MERITNKDGTDRWLVVYEEGKAFFINIEDS